MDDLNNQLVQNQSMVLTPKMLQELKILQMNNQELAQFIEQALVENPLLEVEEPDDVLDELIDEINENDDFEGNNSLNGKEALEKDFTEYVSNPLTLKEHLLLQLGEIKLNFLNKQIAAYIIDNINSDGYLCAGVREIADSLSLPVDKVKRVLKIVQGMEPDGIGARNLKECILIQLKRRNLLNEQIRTIVSYYLDLLAERRYNDISKKTGIPFESITEIHRMIKGLNHKPGQVFSNKYDVSYIIPELLVKEIESKYFVLFMDERTPLLRINESYKSLLKSKSSLPEDRKYIKTKLLKAIEVIKAIEQRKRTILSAASFIVEYQNDFLRIGPSKLKYLTLKMIGTHLGIHESTVSRAINNKFIQTPRGTFALKYFVSSKVDTVESENVSSNGVKGMIKKVISQENKEKPLSDEQIRKVLEDKGIKIARRTVAKYREELSILPANKRK